MNSMEICYCYVIIVMLLFSADASHIDSSNLIQELDILKKTGKHVNLNGLIGCCTQAGKCRIHKNEPL